MLLGGSTRERPPPVGIAATSLGDKPETILVFLDHDR